MKKSFAAFAVLAVLAVLPISPAAAQTCDRSGCGRAACATPATPAPADRWGGLRPLDSSIPACTAIGPAFCRDSTSFDEFTQPYYKFPWFMSLDTENGYLFVALAYGLQVWDARAFPPQPKSELSFQAFPVWSENPEVKWPLQDVDAPAGVDDEVALAGLSGIGLVLVDVADKENPKILYQSYLKDGNQVYAATLGGRRYAFLAAVSGSHPGGLLAFDMTQAKLYDRCSEATPTPGETTQCPGVFLGPIGSRQSLSYVDGVDRFVVASSGSSGTFDLWDVGDPASPQLKLSQQIAGATNGVALWKQGSVYYLAVRTVTVEGVPARTVHRLSIYDVSCIASSCSALGAPVFAGEFDGGGTAEFLDFSRSDGGTPFLYLGSDDRCSGGTQREWLLDVSNPASPVDVSPFNYWGWYYRGGPTGFNSVMPRSGKFVGPVFYRAALSIFDFHQRTGLTGGGGSAINVSGPDAGVTGDVLAFTASPVNCSPGGSGWTWSAGDGAIVSPAADGPTISVRWDTAGNKAVSARHAACGSALGLKAVAISGTGTLDASFTFSPSSAHIGQAFTFDASSSSGGPSTYTWSFGDGTTSSGKVVTHAYTQAGAFTVVLTVLRPGSGTGCSSGICSDSTQRVVVVVGDGPPPPNAAFNTSAACVNQFGFDQCQATAGVPVTFTAVTAGAASYQWDFGDGTTASGPSAAHAWSQPGDYVVSLTAGNGQTTDTRTKTFHVSSSGPGETKTVLLPWIAQTRGALVQSSDLHVHNPGSSPVDVTLEFRKRGVPDTNPPRATRTIAPGATLFFADVLKDLFNRENLSGFLTVTAGPGAVEPVVTSFNVTFQGSSRFGQTIQGVTQGDAVPSVQQLVGLNDNAERLAYFGITNPNAAPATYRLRFFNAAGVELGHSADLGIAAFSQRQFQTAEIRSAFHVSGSDYRVQVETLAGGPLVPYGSNLRLATNDPSFVEPAAAKTTRAYLVGVVSAPGLFGSIWRTDAVLANPGAQALHAQLSFTSVGPSAQPTSPLALTLQPGETRRLVDVVNGQWGIRNAIGVLTLASLEPSGVLPVFQGESYDNSHPSRRFGQSMTARGDGDAAAAGHGQMLAGLRNDADYRTVLWLFNPAAEAGLYDLVYRAADGTVLGRLDGIALGPGKARQLGPGQHPVPQTGLQGGFTVQALVRSGRLLAAAQVVNNATNDPAYVRGETR